MDAVESGLEGRFFTEPDMALDVVDIGDGVVYHQPEAQDQREERHPVQREAEGVVGEQSQCEADRHRNPYHQALAPAHGQRDQDHHRQDGEGHAGDQIVDPQVGRMALIAGHGQFDIGGNDRTFRVIGGADDSPGHGHCVHPGFFAESDGYRGTAVAADIGFGRFRSIGYLSHVIDPDDPVVARGNHDIADGFGACQRRIGQDHRLGAVVNQRADVAGGVGAADRVVQILKRKFSRRQVFDDRFDLDGTGVAAENLGAGEIGNRIQPRGQLFGEAAQLVRRIVAAGKR
ncbi:hypothetical protein SDC9_135683 [bioreactor metagenome]|uniref:Uncharacterized protein n=1 Tax=bioreactor metagenome TaxID=1076179 RepID=A0A645DH15_9ZZZZ